MKTKLFVFSLVVFCTIFSSYEYIPSVMTLNDETTLNEPEFYPRGIQNTAELTTFLNKLKALQNTKEGKVNVVHIGDSHIQGDVMTAVCRQNLQKSFGNGGRGLVFPFTLAHTNGSPDVRFSSNVKWNNHKNILPINGSPVGLSGIALSSKSKSLRLSLLVKNKDYFFNTIKVITPNNSPMFERVGEVEKNEVVKVVPKKIIHTIKKGEVLSTIADQYNVSVSMLKKANKLSSNKITAGKSLKIPTTQTQDKTVVKTKYHSIPLEQNEGFHFFESEKAMDRFEFLPNQEADAYSLNGVVLENTTPGILYHNIGVNGAKFSDYNKYPMFFEQLKALQPDLVIVSLGTNESYGKISPLQYLKDVQTFLLKVRTQSPEADILIITPPPSYLPHHKQNIFVDEYSTSLINYAQLGQYAVWDMFQVFGGMTGVRANYQSGLMSPDRVHYTTAGYQWQGKMLTKVLLDAYKEFNKN
jgi:LysM repeat protein/lysophospholipase L1-like esterase